MIRHLPVILVLIAICFGGCKKDVKSPVSLSDSYFPVTKGSSWTYKDILQDLGTDTVTTTLTGDSAIFNGKTFYVASSTSRFKGNGTDYFYAAKHAYIFRSLNAYAGQTVELEVYNDTAKLKQGNISIPTDQAIANSIPARAINTIEEINLTRTIDGKVFSNVIHTHVDFQYDYENGNGFQTNFTYDFYIAKGIGIIEYDLFIYGAVAERETILNYNIK